ncbi:hypothetical protein B0H13DRAFT_2330385 [Mycena leptocephala]|nr:hypothetical protein B0H13DRAFT_2330385 [Mycena leptocephala]
MRRHPGPPWVHLNPTLNCASPPLPHPPAFTFPARAPPCAAALPAQSARSRPRRPHRAYPTITAEAINAVTPPQGLAEAVLQSTLVHPQTSLVSRRLRIVSAPAPPAVYLSSSTPPASNPSAAPILIRPNLRNSIHATLGWIRPGPLRARVHYPHPPPASILHARTRPHLKQQGHVGVVCSASSLPPMARECRVRPDCEAVPPAHARHHANAHHTPLARSWPPTSSLSPPARPRSAQCYPARTRLVAHCDPSISPIDAHTVHAPRFSSRAAVAAGGHPSSRGADARTLEDAAQLSDRTPR